MLKLNLQTFGGRGGTGTARDNSGSTTTGKATPGIDKKGNATNVGMANLPVGSIVEATIKGGFAGEKLVKDTFELKPVYRTGKSEPENYWFSKNTPGWSFKNTQSEITKELWDKSGVKDLKVKRNGILDSIQVGNKTYEVNPDGTMTELTKKKK